MANTRFVNENIPDNILDFFTIDDDVVKWVSVPPARSKSFRNRRAPWGSAAGGRTVYGRGKLVTFAHAALLTTDIKYALEHGGDWPWQTAAGPQHDGNSHDIAIWRALIHNRFKLDDEGNIIWRMNRGYTATGEPQYKEGDLVTGYQLSGFRGRMVTTGGMGFLSCDVVNVLKNNTFLFEWD